LHRALRNDRRDAERGDFLKNQERKKPKGGNSGVRETNDLSEDWVNLIERPEERTKGGGTTQAVFKKFVYGREHRTRFSEPPGRGGHGLSFKGTLKKERRLLSTRERNKIQTPPTSYTKTIQGGSV